MTSKQPRRDVTSLLRDSVSGFSTYAPNTYDLTPAPVPPAAPAAPAACSGERTVCPGVNSKNPVLPGFSAFLRITWDASMDYCKVYGPADRSFDYDWVEFTYQSSLKIVRDSFSFSKKSITDRMIRNAKTNQFTITEGSYRII